MGYLSRCKLFNFYLVSLRHVNIGLRKSHARKLDRELPFETLPSFFFSSSLLYTHIFSLLIQDIRRGSDLDNFLLHKGRMNINSLGSPRQRLESPTMSFEELEQFRVLLSARRELSYSFL